MGGGKRKLKYSLLFGITISISIVLGKQIDNGGLKFDVFSMMNLFPSWIGSLIISSFIFYYFVGKIEKQSIIRIERKIGYKTFLMNIFLLLICWIPVLMAYYPGIFAYDASVQIMQVIDGNYNTHHPLLHTYLLGSLFCLGTKLKDANLGVLIYTVFQMLIMSSVFSLFLCYIKRKGISRFAYILCFLFYAVFPVNSMLVISTTKDVLFAGIVLLIILWNIVFIKIEKPNFVFTLCGVVLLLFCFLFRNNALYALLISFPMLFCVKEKTVISYYIKVILLSMSLFLIIQTAINQAFHAEKGSMVEMMSLPLQQMARTGNYYNEMMTEEERDQLYFFIPEEVVSKYAPNISDAVKNNIEGSLITENWLRFLKTYIKMGLKFPISYIEAFLSNTQGFWYLLDETNANIYGSGEGSRLGYILTNYKDMPDEYKVIHKSYLPQLESLYERLFSENEYQNSLIGKLIFAPALYWWLLFLYVIANIYLRQYKNIVPSILLIGYYLTLLLGPTCIIRYMYPIVVCIPPLFYNLIQTNEKSYKRLKDEKN